MGLFTIYMYMYMATAFHECHEPLTHEFMYMYMYTMCKITCDAVGQVLH